MRLTNLQVTDIIRALDPFIEGNKATLRLYGSRLDDKRKGGDIDLLLLSEQTEFIQTLLTNKHVVLSAIKKNIGDQKIDLLIADNSAVGEDPFLQIIFPSSLVLKEW
jgi:hypothetical protein